MVFAQRHPALRGDVGEGIFGAFRLQIRFGLLILGIECRRVDFGEDIALLYQRAVILVPHLHIARDLGVDRRLKPSLNIAGERNRLGRCPRLWSDDRHGGDGVFERLLAQQRGVAFALINPIAEVQHAQQDR